MKSKKLIAATALLAVTLTAVPVAMAAQDSVKKWGYWENMTTPAAGPEPPVLITFTLPADPPEHDPTPDPTPIPEPEPPVAPDSPQTPDGPQQPTRPDPGPGAIRESPQPTINIGSISTSMQPKTSPVSPTVHGNLIESPQPSPQ